MDCIYCPCYLLFVFIICLSLRWSETKDLCIFFSLQGFQTNIPAKSTCKEMYTHHHIKCSDSRLTAVMRSRTELISVSYQQQPHVNSKGSLCSKILKCIIYALVDLIETENVMFHSSTLLISRQSPTNVVALLQAPSAPRPRLVGQIRQRGEALISTELT